MADKTGYIGRNPGDSSVKVARQTFTPSTSTTDFTFAAGYTVGYVDLYLNGAKLIEGTDFNANDGSTISMVSDAQSGDVLEAVAYKAFNVGDAASSTAGNFSVGNDITVSNDAKISNDLNVTGIGTVGEGFNVTAGGINVVAGVSTFAGVTNASSDVRITGNINAGIATFTSVAGDGSALTGVANTDIVHTREITASGVSTYSGDVQFNRAVGTAASITWDASAKELLILDDVKTKYGTGGDLSMYHDGSNSYLTNSTGGLYIRGVGADGVRLQKADGSGMVVAVPDDAVTLYYAGSSKLATTNTGAVVTGILTATGDIETTGGNLTVGLGKSINIDGNYDTVKIQERSVGVGTTSTAGRDAGIGTATGTMIWNASLDQLQVYDGSAWKRAAGETLTATGGSEDTGGRPGWTVHTFTGSGAFTVQTGAGTIEYAFWAGGGGGSGHAGGGGGGAGGFRSGTLDVTPGPYAVTIGNGGTGGPTSSGVGGGEAGDSSLTPTIIAYGGGGGGDNAPIPGFPGGSGGGTGGSNPTPTNFGYGYNPSTPSPQLDPALQPLHPYPITQGYNGGENVQPTHTGGGGGGSGAVGTDGNPSQGGNGGAGATTSVPGSSTQKGGGGGAGAHNPGKNGGEGGAGGGADGSPSGPDVKAPSASANTASGGGGGGGINGSAPSSGGDGGSGVMYIAYES